MASPGESLSLISAILDDWKKNEHTVRGVTVKGTDENKQNTQNQILNCEK